MIILTVREAAQARGINRAYRLQRAAGLYPSTAAKLWSGDARQIDLDILGKVMAALKCELTDLLAVKADAQPETAEPEAL